MNKKLKIIIIYQKVLFYNWVPSFIQKDIEIFKKHFDTTAYLFRIIKIVRLPFEIRKADMVFVWFAGYHAFVTTLINLVCKKPLVLVAGGYDVADVKEMRYGWLINPLSKRMIRFVLRHASKILAVSEFNKDEMARNLDITTAEVVYLSVDNTTFVPKGKKERLIIAVSAVDSLARARVKGLDVFLQVAKKLPHEKFLIIGTQKKALQQLKELASSNVTFLPPLPQEELLQYYQKAKVICQLSYYESFGVAVAEAMSCACIPAVSSRGALPELVGDTGYCTEYGNINEIAEAIISALQDQVKGEQARKRIIEHFSVEQREQRLLTLIQLMMQD